jgi:hypothetical protein
MMDASKLKALANMPPGYMQMYGMLPSQLNHLVDNIDEFMRVVDNAREALEGLFGQELDLNNKEIQKIIVDSLL